MSIIAIAASLALGVTSSPAGADENAQSGKLKQVMQRNDRLIQLSDADCRKPPLLLLHGATDDPTEMMAIAREWKNEYNVFLYSYNYHKRVEKVAADFVAELKRLKGQDGLADGGTVIAFSYGAIVFREAVILARDRSLFSGDRLIQLVPTAGGSFFARGMENRVAAMVISLASKPSAAANPYGSFAKQVWEGEGNEKFYSVISPKRMLTILVEGDANSVSRIKDEKVQQRYRNGIGENVIVIPRSAGVTHEYFPVEPAGLEYLRQVMESPTIRANAEKKTAG
jgi:pimeloyl-ACP methyl ester carboxylesterase